MKKEKTEATNSHQKPLQELTLLDRFLFRAAMEIPIVNRNMLGILLGKPIELVQHRNAEARYRESA